MARRAAASGRKSPAKVEGEADLVRKNAVAEAITAGKTPEEAAAIGDAARAEFLTAIADAEKGEGGGGEGSGEGTGGDGGDSGDGDDEEEDLGGGDVGKANVFAKVIPELVATRIAKDARKPSLKPEERDLLAEACYVFGINPDPTLKPRELAAYRYDEGDPNGATPIPAHVSIVTSGGLKIRYPLDEDSVLRLQNVYNCYKVNKAGEREVLPLPPDMTLPREQVDGISKSTEHQYRTGYVREGGKEAADRKDALADLRRQGKIR